MATESVRPAAVAGSFYPEDPRALLSEVSRLFARVDESEARAAAPKAIVVPHAGYIYSGGVAASAFALLRPVAEHIRRVVLIGPAHRVAFRGFAIPGAQAFMTPLGLIPLSRTDWLALGEREDVIVDDRPHASEHCLEVQLPFLQHVLPQFEIVPVLVGDAGPKAVAGLLSALWGGSETLIVISSDLSHYLPYQVARRVDATTLDEIMSLRATLDPEQACGARPLNGLLTLAGKWGLKPQLIEMCNSGDTAGDRARVVGYASIAFYEENVGDNLVRH